MEGAGLTDTTADEGLTAAAHGGMAARSAVYNRFMSPLNVIEFLIWHRNQLLYTHQL